MFAKFYPEYARLAYRKAIVRGCIEHLQQRLGDFGSPAPFIADEMRRAESEVPAEVVQDFLDEMEQEASALSKELAQFDLVKRTNGKEAPKLEAKQPEQTKQVDEPAGKSSRSRTRAPRTKAGEA